MKLGRLLEPSSMAIVGVSKSNPLHPANVIYNKNHLRHQARTYCVNPSGGTLYGEPMYRDVAEIPEKIDLAVLAVRAEYVVDSVKKCIKAGASGAIVISGGFAEIGRSDVQDELRKLAIENEFPVIGPNCLGIYSMPYTDAFFLPEERLVRPRPGKVALVSQSGGILVDLMIKMTQEGVGISKAISIGNKAVIDEVDLLEHLGQDASTKVIGFYTEGFLPGRGRTFIEAVENCPKEVVIIKSGKTPGGSRAVSSHTASLAGDYRIFSEVLKDTKAHEARNEAEFVAYCEALGSGRTKDVKNVCIVTGSGGHGAMAADVCFDRGLDLIDLPDDDQAKLKEQLTDSIRPIASVANPIDLTGSAVDADFYNAARFCLMRSDVDCVIVLLLPYLPGITSDVGGRVAQLSREFGKPIVGYVPHVERFAIFVDGFEANGVPVSHSVEGAVYMAESLMRRNQ